MNTCSFQLAYASAQLPSWTSISFVFFQFSPLLLSKLNHLLPHLDFLREIFIDLSIRIRFCAAYVGLSRRLHAIWSLVLCRVIAWYCLRQQVSEINCTTYVLPFDSPLIFHLDMVIFSYERYSFFRNYVLIPEIFGQQPWGPIRTESFLQLCQRCPWLALRSATFQ